MAITIKYRMLSGLESSGGKNMVWAEGANAAELATASAASGSIGTIAGDSDSLYVYDGTTWNLIDKEGLAAGVTYEGISPQTLLMVNKLLAVPMTRLAAVENAAGNLNLQILKKTLTSVNGSTGVTTEDAILGWEGAIVEAGAVITQDGAGSQSFAVPKPIVGNETVTVTMTYGTDDEETISLTPEAPVYGLSGIEDTVTSAGGISRKTKHIVLTGAETWTAGAEGVAPYVLTLADKAAGTTNFACSHSVPAASGTAAETCVGAAAAKTITFNPNLGEEYNKLTKWKALLLAASITDTPVQLVYELDDEILAVEGGMVQTISMPAVATKFSHDGGGAISLTYARDLTATIAVLEAGLPGT